MILPFTFGLALGPMIAGVFVIALKAEREWTAELEETLAQLTYEQQKESLDFTVSHDPMGGRLLPPSTHIVPMGVQEVEDAEMERQIRMHMENFPVRKERHLFAVDEPTAQVYQIPLAPRSGDAA